MIEPIFEIQAWESKDTEVYINTDRGYKERRIVDYAVLSNQN